MQHRVPAHGCFFFSFGTGMILRGRYIYGEVVDLIPSFQEAIWGGFTKKVDGIEEPFNYAYSSWDIHIWR
jgi:hypothetical protein